MGLSIGKRCWTNPSEPAAVAPNPDPSRFKILNHYEYNGWTIVKVFYEGCTNFEGNKVLVFDETYAVVVAKSARGMDPHFSSSGLSPVARFEPTTRGWHLAQKFVHSLD